MSSTEFGQPGSGTYERHGYIFSSLTGTVVKDVQSSSLPIISVTPRIKAEGVPEVDAIVTCKVRKFKLFAVAFPRVPVTLGIPLI